MMKRIGRPFSILVSSLTLLLTLALATAVAGVVSELIPNGVKLNLTEMRRARFHPVSPTESSALDKVLLVDPNQSSDRRRSASTR